MKNINDYLLMIIGNYLGVQDILRLSASCKKCHTIFRDYYELYKRECKRLFLGKCKLFKNLLMSKNPSTSQLTQACDPGFL
jgi:hypothetical protein